jgi:uncharacterized delta-60 repeat protein
MIERLKRIILAGMFLLIYTSFFSLHAQWAITYGGSGYDRVHSIQKTNDGGYIVEGETSSFGVGLDDIWLLKLSTAGEIEWQKTYGSDYSKDWAYSVQYSVQQTGDGGYIIIGNTSSFGAGHDDIWILKLSSNGDIEWQKTYGAGGDDWFHSIQKTDDGGYIAAGKTGSFGAGRGDIWLLKLSTAGDIEWQKTYGGSEGDVVHSIQPTSDDGYVVAGISNSFSGDLYISDIWILKLSSEGDIEWQKTYGVSDDWKEVHSIQQTSDGGYIVAGNISSDIWISKLSSAGDIEWQKTYGVSDLDEVYSFQPTSDGGYIVVGETGYGDYDIWLLKLSTAGDIEWQKTYGGSDREEVHSIQPTSDGGYIVAGSTSSFGEGWYDIWVLKLSPAGDIEWQKTYGSNYSPDEAHSIQQTMDGDYIVAGETNSWGAGGEIWVLKLLANGDINPLCAFINTSDAEVSDTNIMPEDTDIIAADTDITPQDTDITPQDTDISPQDSDANVYKLCVSNTCTLTLSASSGGTTSPTPGTYTYDTGTEVTLNAVPTSGGYGFLVWEGNVQASVHQITITMDGDKTISANFYKPPPPSYGGGDADEWGGGGPDIGPSCLIATAAYGSPLHPYVETLREFRDSYLMPSKLGRMLVSLYYKYSPFVADLIAKYKLLKVAVRFNLLPIIAFSYLILHFGPIISGVMVVFIFMFPVFLVWRYRKKRRRHRKETKNKMIESFDT